jgi:iron complex outermembrane recepter protein
MHRVSGNDRPQISRGSLRPLAGASSAAARRQRYHFTLRQLQPLAALVFLLCFAVSGRAEPAEFNLPAQSADRALLAFSKQAKVDVLFSFDDLRQVRSNPVTGRYEPQQALELLLRDTGFVARRNGEAKWIVTPNAPPRGKIKGKLLAPDGSPARRVYVAALPSAERVWTSDTGDFELPPLPPGTYTVVVGSASVSPLRIAEVAVVASRTVELPPYRFQRGDDLTRLEPFVVHESASRAESLDHSDAPFAPRSAGGNLDLPRTESQALPYTIFNRTQISRSGVVNLNEFLQRELIDSNAATLPPEQNGATDSFKVGSTNLSLRGFEGDETVILVDGRRLPEVLISGGPDPSGARPIADVNFIPLGLVQQIEVLPISASSLYSGSAVGGVINIVLRPDVAANASEVTATYTNALRGFDAPQSAISLLHAQTLLGGALRVRLNASFTQAIPATEAELGYHQRRATPVPLDAPVFRATPNIRSIRPPDATAATPAPSLFGPGTPSVTSVAPGADGTGGLAPFRGREGVRNVSFFDAPGQFAPSLDSVDYPYGRQQTRATYYGSVVYDIFPWLQLAADGTYSKTTVHRGYDVMSADLKLPAASPYNPFGQDVMVSLNETAKNLGEDYSEARLEFGSGVFSAMVKLPSDWRLTFDAQYAHNLVKYRGLVGADPSRWQALVDRGAYNPLRDTQVIGPPPAFYDEVLVYRGRYDRFVTLGNYDTIDLAVRGTNESLTLPTGTGVLNVGVDYRRNHLAKYTQEGRYADGTPAGDALRWDGRSLGRYSAFGELQSPLLPSRRLPQWLHRIDGDLALRYVASSDAHESNFAPTFGLKATLAGGFSLRGSLTWSNRFPTPQMSRLAATPGGEGPTIDREPIDDPIRQQHYLVAVTEVVTPDLKAEAAVTQTAGLIFERGEKHRFRATLDFLDTHKVNELVTLLPQAVVAGEALWPERVNRAAPGPGEAPGSGIITSIVTSRINLASRHSQNWTTGIDYRWTECFGGSLETYARLLYFQRYTVRALPNAPIVDELNAPDGVVTILKYRANFGAAWSGQRFAFGADGHYFHSRLLPATEQLQQGSDRIEPYWQFDLFTQIDLARWLRWKSQRYGLRTQVRVNNILGTEFPKYASDASGAGVQAYGDWRGRVYSLSLTATF